MFLLLVWNGFLLSITFKHLCDKTELLILAVQSLTVLHGSTVNTQTWEPGGRGAVQPMCASRKKSIFQQCSILKRYSWPLVFLTSVKWSGVLAWTLSLAFIKRHLSLELTNSNSGSWEMVFLSHLSRCSIFTHSGFLRRNKFWSIIIHIINYDVNVGVWLPVGKAAWNDKGTSLSPSAGWTPHTLCPFCASHMVTNFQLHHNFNLSSEIFS